MTFDGLKRSFKLSQRLRKRFEEVTLPLEIYQRPSPEVSALFWDALSYLRFLDIHPHVDERWRFSLLLTGPLEESENRTLPRLRGPHLTVLMNLSDRESVSVRLEPPAQTVGPAVAVSVEPLSGIVLEEEASAGCWSLEEGASEEVLPLLIATSAS